MTDLAANRKRLRALAHGVVVAGASGIVGLTAGIAGCQTMPESRYAHCMFDPKEFNWQRLDRSNFVVWSLPSRQAYLLKLDEKLDRRMPAEITFVDGNKDGLLCGDGWDSVMATERLPLTSGTRITSRRVANIFFVEPLTDGGLAHLRSAYQYTMGPREAGAES